MLALVTGTSYFATGTISLMLVCGRCDKKIIFRHGSHGGKIQNNPTWRLLSNASGLLFFVVTVVFFRTLARVFRDLTALKVTATVRFHRPVRVKVFVLNFVLFEFCIVLNSRRNDKDQNFTRITPCDVIMHKVYSHPRFNFSSVLNTKKYHNLLLILYC